MHSELYHTPLYTKQTLLYRRVPWYSVFGLAGVSNLMGFVLFLLFFFKFMYLATWALLKSYMRSNIGIFGVSVYYRTVNNICKIASH